ncbi:MAG TPA: insulinase family protein [Holophagaceae bacterium]|nr:insulinase family protein [Holophagaceae bacterium]
MRFALFLAAAPLLAPLSAPLRALTPSGTFGQAPLRTEARELRLQNGARVLVVERPGIGAFHATLCFRGGAAEEPPEMQGASTLLARTLYAETRPEDLESPPRALEDQLTQEDGLRESLRVERRRLERGSSSEARVEELEATLRALEARRRAGAPSSTTDLYLDLGGRTQARVSQDALTFSVDLPQTQLEAFLKTEALRLQALRLARFPEARASLLAELKDPTRDRGTALLAAAALPGHPYGRELQGSTGSLEGLRWSELRAYARGRLVPERLLMVLVGDLGTAPLLPLLEKTFGTLKAQEAPEPALFDQDGDLGSRRIQAQSGTRDRLLVAWRVPPRSHPDFIALRALLACLVEGPSSRLHQRLVNRGLAKSVSGSLGATGSRQTALLQLDLEPADGVGLASLEGGLQAEILRLQQEPLGPQEWQRLIQQGELTQALDTQSASALARALALGWAEGGDWRLALTAVDRMAKLASETLQAAARKHLQPSHLTEAFLAPELAATDPLEASAAQVLRTLARRRIEDPAQIETLVSETLRQLRMLPREDRERSLKLLQDQVKEGVKLP